jgi:uncharacterized protein (DUF362 family)
LRNLLSYDKVALVEDIPLYAKTPPYHPSEEFPELTVPINGTEDNPAYRGIRNLFYFLEFDRSNYGTKSWNPLTEIVKPGNTVILKPNLVSHFNHGFKVGLTDTDCLVTHGSVIRAVLDYTAKALQGTGKIIIGDCPIQGTEWDKLLDVVGLNQIYDYFHSTYPNIELLVRDYRLGRAIVEKGMVVKRIIDEGAFVDYQEVDLKEESSLTTLMHDKYAFGVSQYKKQRMMKAHTPETNKYLFPKDILYADVVINLPKMKSHMKAGITSALKNLVGINGHKDYLPHFRFGSPRNGGDEYPDGNWLWDLMWFCMHRDWEYDGGLFKRLYFFLTKVCAYFLPIFSGLPKNAARIGGGGWHGNDTLWRTILDINRAFFYYDRGNNRISNEISHDVKYLAILDGLIGGEKESPLSPTPVKSGIMMASLNPLALDSVAAAMMGLDVHKIKQISQGYYLKSLPIAQFMPEDIEIVGYESICCIKDIYKQKAYIAFEPSSGYRGYIEYKS